MFHPLRVAEVRPLTDDSVTISFEVPEELRAAYHYAAGQHIAVRRRVAGAETRRTYSLCDPAPAAGGDGPRSLRVGVRLVTDGEFSTYALKELRPGDVLDVMTPAGRFGLEPRPGTVRRRVVGGSGITPVLSSAATVLAREPRARFCLVRSDRTAASTMFLEEVADLKDRWPGPVPAGAALSREEHQSGLPSGRLDADRLAALLPALLPVAAVEGWFLCGPLGLVSAAERALRTLASPAPASTRRYSTWTRVAGDRPRGRDRRRGGGTYGPRSTAGRAAGRRRARSPCWRRCCATAPTPPTRARAGCAGPAGPGWSPARCGWTATSRWSRRRRTPGYVLACQSHPLTPARRGRLRRVIATTAVTRRAGPLGPGTSGDQHLRSGRSGPQRT